MLSEDSLKVTGETLARIMEAHQKQVEQESRIVAERFLAQLEDALANLCCNRNHRDDVARAAIQLIAERSSHIRPYTPVRFAGNAAKRHKENLAAMTTKERRTVKKFMKWYEEAAGRDYGEATVAVREFYGSLAQLLARIVHEPGHDSFVSVGAWRILDTYHPNLRFQQIKAKQRHGG